MRALPVVLDNRLPRRRPLAALAAVAAAATLALVGAGAAGAHCEHGQQPFTNLFRPQDCTWVNTGRMPFMVLVPGYWLELRGNDDGEQVRLRITVLPQTRLVAGVLTRVVEEREWVDGELAEVSRNYLAICRLNGNVFYFGEEVDNYEDGTIVNHDGSWLAGVDGARAGVLMPGSFLLGSRYFQEIAPGVAMDRGCHSRMNLTVTTPARTFSKCVEVLDSDALHPEDEPEPKMYCPGVGLVRDEALRLVDWSESP